MKKRALITGICGQDGAYLTKLLLEKNYEVCGLDINVDGSKSYHNNLDKVGVQAPVRMIYDADVSDIERLELIVRDFWPDEIYNLAAVTNVHASFDRPHRALDVNAAGALNVLEVARSMHTSVKVLQASSSDMFGGLESVTMSPLRTEASPLRPKSPYAASKVFAHNMIQVYRRTYGLHACSAILFPHESKVRNNEAVSQKIARGAVSVVHGESGRLELGNMLVGRDWGHAEDSVRGMWMALQHDTPSDYIFATGIKRSVLDFTNKAFELLDVRLKWQQDEEGRMYGIDPSGKTVVVSRDNLLRKSDVDTLVGDARFAMNALGWAPRKVFDDVVEEMVQAALDERVKGSSRNAAADRIPS